MTAKTFLPLDQVLPTAQKLVAELAPTCDRIELAGSIRRQKQQVGDIEIVCIPTRTTDLLGDVDMQSPTRLDRLLRSWEEEARISIDKFGKKYKQFAIRLPGKIRMQVDLFVTTPECWPVIFAIRTGPADYSRAFVTQRASAGLLRNGCKVHEGRLYVEGRPVDLRDEKHFFEYVQGGYKTPEER